MVVGACVLVDVFERPRSLSGQFVDSDSVSADCDDVVVVRVVLDCSELCEVFRKQSCVAVVDGGDPEFGVGGPDPRISFGVECSGDHTAFVDPARTAHT